MALRAKKPESTERRLKLFMYGAAGVGKSTAAVQMPKAYIIDAERGTDHYAHLINDSGSVVFQTSDIGEVIAEVKALLTEKHDFRTLVIDPITTIYNDLLEKAEKKVGSEFGRHYGEANKQMKRLSNLLTALDMNVVVTAHAKKEYGQNLAVIGQTFDGWKQLDYIFDLVIELNRQKGKKARTGKVVKTRLQAFPDQDEFEWSYDALRQRCGDIIEREAQVVALASEAQVMELRALLDVVKVPDGWVEKCWTKAGVEDWSDMPTDLMAKSIDFLKSRLTGKAA